jgi:hypothetical protein
MGPAPGAKGSARRHAADLGAVINPCGCFGLDMGGKPGSISVQMAPGDTTVGSRPCGQAPGARRGDGQSREFHELERLSPGT